MPKLTYSQKEVLDELPIGKTSFYKLIKSGDLDKVKVGRRTLVTGESLHALVQRRTCR
jgi:hypothetical protein